MTLEDFSMRFNDIANMIDSVQGHKQRFQELLRDQTIPLNDRWDAYQYAPDYMLNSPMYFDDNIMSDFPLSSDIVRLPTLNYGEQLSGIQLFELLVMDDEGQLVFDEHSEDGLSAIIDIKEWFLSKAYGNQLTYYWA